MRRTNTGEQGQTLVEAALALTVFFFVLFGAFDVGRAVWNYNTLAQATREGTRYAIVHGADSSNPSGPGDDQDIADVVVDHGSGLDPAALNVTVEWPDGGNVRGDHVTVNTEYTYTPFFDFWGAVSFDLNSSSTMEIQN